MPNQQPTIGELYKANTVTDEAINTAVDAILAGDEDEAFPIAVGWTLNLPAALVMHPPSAKALADVDQPDAFRRAMARSAVILARPVKA